MMKEMLGVSTSIVAALAVVGVAWAGADVGTSTSVTADSSTSISQDDGSSSTGTEVDSSTSSNVDPSTSSSLDNESSSSTSTSIAATTSTSNDAASTTSTSVGSSTSTSIDDDDDDVSVVAEGHTTHVIPGVGTVTIEVTANGTLTLVDVTAVGWSIEHDKIEGDRIELEFTSGIAEAEFEARLKDGRVEVRIEVDSD